ncbi:MULTISPECIES: hypothetical protein [unclassified Rhodococcus (in: high G+C Gram-positive bacteria)]|nr:MULTISPECIES: hypothetical protein [unclassified Rhodococcus (in: high G+C Gram-positive bacteria)]
MRLVPAYTPDPDYIDRQIDAELTAEHPTSRQTDSEHPEIDKAAS